MRRGQDFCSGTSGEFAANSSIRILTFSFFLLHCTDASSFQQEAKSSQSHREHEV
jgi:hypothetical protein